MTWPISANESTADGWHPRDGRPELQDALRILDWWDAAGMDRRAIQAALLSEVHGIYGTPLSQLLGWSPSMVAGFLTRSRVMDPTGYLRLREIGARCDRARERVLEVALPFRLGGFRGVQPSYLYVAVGGPWIKFGRASTISRLEARIAIAAHEVRVGEESRRPLGVLRAQFHGDFSAAQVEDGLSNRYRARWRDQRREVVCASLLPDLLDILWRFREGMACMSTFRGTTYGQLRKSDVVWQDALHPPS